jgi:hypothetical protein
MLRTANQHGNPENVSICNSNITSHTSKQKVCMLRGDAQHVWGTNEQEPIYTNAKAARRLSNVPWRHKAGILAINLDQCFSIDGAHG